MSKPTSAKDGKKNPVDVNANSNNSLGKIDRDCMPDNPFLPNEMFEDNSGKMKTHVGLFFAICAAIRLVRLIGNMVAPAAMGAYQRR